MKDILIVLLAPSIFLFSGCTSSKPELQPYKLRPSPNVKALSVDELCKIHLHENWEDIFYAKYRPYGSVTGPATPEQIAILKQEVLDARAELKRRQPFGKSVTRLVVEKKIRVGMSKKALLCSWGHPSRINRSSYGPDQYVYEGESAYDTQYVYLRGNRVTAWQD